MADRRVQKLLNSLKADNEGFVQMVETLEGMRASCGAGAMPELEALNEMRRVLLTASRWCQGMQRDASAAIDAIKANGSVHTLRGPGPPSAPGAGATPARPIKLPHVDRAPEVNDFAASKISTTDPWCLSKVKSFNDITELVEVFDVEDSKKRTYKVKRAQVVLLPRAKEAQPRFYPKGSKVFALYPGTTSFYPARVVDNTIRKDGEHFLKLYFDDDEDDTGVLPGREVACKHVTVLPSQGVDGV
jgi:hypothetical protein